jgi:hypothetical protein
MQFAGFSCVIDAKVAYFCLYYARIMTLICFILKTSLHAKENMSCGFAGLVRLRKGG